MKEKKAEGSGQDEYKSKKTFVILNYPLSILHSLHARRRS